MDEFFGTDTLATIRNDIKDKLSIKREAAFNGNVQKEVIDVIKVQSI